VFEAAARSVDLLNEHIPASFYRSIVRESAVIETTPDVPLVAEADSAGNAISPQRDNPASRDKSAASMPRLNTRLAEKSSGMLRARSRARNRDSSWRLSTGIAGYFGDIRWNVRLM
jgi:hypothetical protein